MDKNQAIIEFLMTCPYIADNPVYFNFTEAQDNSKSIITVASDKAVNKAYIDGSVRKRFSFTIIDFKSIIDQALPIIPGYVSENVADVFDVQTIIDWIEEQNENKNYPNFGDTCLIEDMRTTSETPNLNGVDSQQKPNLAKYSITIIIEYIDISKRIWS